MGEGIRSGRENSDLEFAPPVSMLWPVRWSPDSKPIMPNSAQKFGQIIRKLTQQRHHFFRPLLRVSAVFDGDAVGKIEGIVDVEGGQG